MSSSWTPHHAVGCCWLLSVRPTLRRRQQPELGVHSCYRGKGVVAMGARGCCDFQGPISRPAHSAGLSSYSLWANAWGRERLKLCRAPTHTRGFMSRSLGIQKLLMQTITPQILAEPILFEMQLTYQGLCILGVLHTYMHTTMVSRITYY